MHELKQRREEWGRQEVTGGGLHRVKGPKEKLLLAGLVTAGLVLMGTFR